MKRTKPFAISIISLLSLSAFSGTLLVRNGLKDEIVEVSAYTSGDGATYYNSISDELTGTTLLGALQSLNNEKLQSRVGYDNMPYNFRKTDPGTSSNQVTSFYSGRSASYSGNMNREHVWPASRTVLGRGNDPLEDDIHMVRPTLIEENSGRGNSFFVQNPANGQYEGWDPAVFSNPSYRGDAARIIFYCVVADPGLSIVDLKSDYTDNHTMGKLSNLLLWNLEYPVSERERVRNEAAESLQGNRNPFIDHPEYASKIWGSTNKATESACNGTMPTDIVSGMSSIDIKLNTESIQKELDVEIGKTYTFNAYCREYKIVNATWSLLSYGGNKPYTGPDFTGVASNGGFNVTVIGDDSVTLSVKYSYYEVNTLKKIEKKITLNTASIAPAQPAKGCGGNISTTSVVLSSLAAIGIMAIVLSLSLRRKKENNL